MLLKCCVTRTVTIPTSRKCWTNWLGQLESATVLHSLTVSTKQTMHQLHSFINKNVYYVALWMDKWESADNKRRQGNQGKQSKAKRTSAFVNQLCCNKGRRGMTWPYCNYWDWDVEQCLATARDGESPFCVGKEDVSNTRALQTQDLFVFVCVCLLTGWNNHLYYPQFIVT